MIATPTKGWYMAKNQLSEDAWRQHRKAADDLIDAMGRFNALMQRDTSVIDPANYRDEVAYQKALTDVRYRAMQSVGIKEAIADCHWATERVNAFGMLYQCALIREDQIDALTN